MKPKIIVTGKDGQLGWELLQLAPKFEDKYEFVFCGRQELDLLKPNEIKAFIEKEQPRFFINCAAYTAVDKAETEQFEACAINVIAPKTIAETCKNIDCSLIHISTDYVFDGEKKQPYLPTDIINPLNVYGSTKAEGEKLVLNSGCKAAIIRTSWVYSTHGKNFVKTMLKLMSEREELNVVSDQVGSPTYAADLAEVIMQIISSGINKTKIYHYSNTGNISWYDFAVAIKEMGNKNCKVNAIPSSMYPTPAKRSSYSTMDCSDIICDFNIELKDWKQSLEIAIGKLN